MDSRSTGQLHRVGLDIFSTAVQHQTFHSQEESCSWHRIQCSFGEWRPEAEVESSLEADCGEGWESEGPSSGGGVGEGMGGGCTEELGLAGAADCAAMCASSCWLRCCSWLCAGHGNTVNT